MASIVSPETAGAIDQELSLATPTPTESARGSERWWSFRHSAKGAFIGLGSAVVTLGAIVAINGSLAESADIAKILLATGAGSGAVLGGVRMFRYGFWSMLYKIPRHPEIDW